MSKNSLGPIIKQMRRQKNLTQAELGKMTGYSQNTVSNHENKKRALSEKGISKYAQALGMTPQELFMKTQTNYKPQYRFSYYDYYDVGLSAGVPTVVSPFTPTTAKRIAIADDIMGQYAGNPNIFITKINGESMNQAIPNHSLIAVRKVPSWRDLCNGDIVVFQDVDGLAIKHFYFDNKQQIIYFKPNSSDNRFTTITYQLVDAENIKILGKVIGYTVRL